MPTSYSECCPPNPIQIGQRGPDGKIGPSGPTTPEDVIAVGGVMGLTICGVPLTRNAANGYLTWNPSSLHGIGCIGGDVAVIADAASVIPVTVGPSGVAVGPVDMLSTTATLNFCAKAAQCRAGGLTPQGAVATAGTGLVVEFDKLAIGQDLSSGVPYTVTALGLNIGPVPAAQVSGLCPAISACIAANLAGYQAQIVTTAAVCAAGGLTGVASTDTVTLTKSASCVVTADVRLDPASPLAITATAAGIAVAAPTVAQLCALGLVAGVASTPTVAATLSGTCVASFNVNPAALISSGANLITVGGDGLLLVSCVQTRQCISATGPIQYNAGTGVISMSPGAAGQVLTTVAGTITWAAPAGLTSPNGTLLFGTGTVDVDWTAAANKNGICSVLGGYATNGTAAPGATWLVGADCKLYQIPASSGGGGTYTAGCGVLISGTNVVSVDRAALAGLAGSTSLQAGSGTCDLRVIVDGLTVKRAVSGALTVDACEVTKAGIASLAATAPKHTDKFMVVDTAGNCQVRNVPGSLGTIAYQGDVVVNETTFPRVAPYTGPFTSGGLITLTNPSTTMPLFLELTLFEDFFTNAYVAPSGANYAQFPANILFSTDMSIDGGAWVRQSDTFYTLPWGWSADSWSRERSYFDFLPLAPGATRTFQFRTRYEVRQGQIDSGGNILVGVTARFKGDFRDF